MKEIIGKIILIFLFLIVIVIMGFILENYESELISFCVGSFLVFYFSIKKQDEKSLDNYKILTQLTTLKAENEQIKEDLKMCLGCLISSGNIIDLLPFMSPI